MRVKKSFFNGISNSLILVVRSILLFAVRIVFVRTLGKVYLGVDSLFTNLLMVLSITDLGVTTAINFNLYEPLSRKDYNKVSVLMTFYKKVYNILGIIVICIGLAFTPFIHLLVNEPVEHLHFIFILYLLTTASSYFISYKDSLLNADQNQYKSSLIVASTYITMYILRIVALILLPNFILYVLIQFVMLIIQRILVNRYITKSYPQVDFNCKEKVPKKEQKAMFKNVRSMFMNKLGTYLVNCGDNIIISAVPGLGVILVGIYSNYYSVTNTADTILARGIGGATSSFGDLAVSEGSETQENVFNKLLFLTFLIYGLISVGFVFLLSPLIKICFGSDFVLSKECVYLIAFNFYLIGSLKTLDVVKEATGNYVQDRYVNIIQAVINIAVSIFLGIKFGLIGVILGTTISYIVLPLWNRPYIAYKYIFNKKPFNYFKKQFIYLISLLIIVVLIGLILNNIIIPNQILEFFIKGIIIVILYFVFARIIFFKTDDYKYYYKLIKKRIIHQET